VKQPYPYEHAPRLAAQGAIDVSTLTAQQQGDLEIEIGPGRGAFVLERVEERLDARVVGLEIRWKWATLVDERLHKLALSSRARVYAEDARMLLPRLQPDGCVSSFFIHFPDPWWKARQKKRLVIGRPLLDQVARLLAPSGMLFVQTDVIERGEVYEALVDAHEAFAPDGDALGSARMAVSPWVARGNREKRAEQDGIPVVRLRYRKKR
jgi:tRNA (guanine-N7-)-methyltransferase